MFSFEMFVLTDYVSRMIILFSWLEFNRGEKCFYLYIQNGFLVALHYVATECFCLCCIFYLLEVSLWRDIKEQDIAPQWRYGMSLRQSGRYCRKHENEMFLRCGIYIYLRYKNVLLRLIFGKFCVMLFWKGKIGCSYAVIWYRIESNVCVNGHFCKLISQFDGWEIKIWDAR